MKRKINTKEYRNRKVWFNLSEPEDDELSRIMRKTKRDKAEICRIALVNEIERKREIRIGGSMFKVTLPEALEMMQELSGEINEFYRRK